MYMLPLFQMLKVRHMWRDSTRHCMVDCRYFLPPLLLPDPCSRSPLEPWSAAAAAKLSEMWSEPRSSQAQSHHTSNQQPAVRQHKQTGHLHNIPAQGSVWRGSKVGWKCPSLSIVYHIHSVVSPLLSILSSNSLSPYNIYFDRLSRGNHPWDSVESRRDFQKFENTKCIVYCSKGERMEPYWSWAL